MTFLLLNLRGAEIYSTFGQGGTCVFNLFLWSSKNSQPFLLENTQVPQKKWESCRVSGCLNPTHLPNIWAMGFQTVFIKYYWWWVRQPVGHVEAWWTCPQASYLCQGRLVCLWYFPSFKGRENSPCAAGSCGNILGEMWHLLAQLWCSMLCSYGLLSEQHLGMDG